MKDTSNRKTRAEAAFQKELPGVIAQILVYEAIYAALARHGIKLD